MLALLAAATAVAPTPPATRSVQAAVQVVRDLYSALDRRDYRRAFALWSGGKSFADYRGGYRHTVRTQVIPLPPFDTEGSTGHAWADIRVRVEAVLNDGRHQRFTGTYTLSRVNDVDGSTTAQRRWHIVSARLKRLAACR